MIENDLRVFFGNKKVDAGVVDVRGIRGGGG